MTINFFDGSDGVTLTCEIAISDTGGSYGIWGTSLWGTGKWGPDVAWVDLSARIRGFGTTRKFDRTMERWQTGTGWVLLDNRDGDLSPSNLAGTYVIGGRSTIKPGRPIRLRATYSSVTYGLIYGVCDDWQEEIISVGPNAGDAAVRIPIVDTWADLAIDGAEQASAGAGDTFGARVHRILDAAGHKGARAVEIGEATMQATTLASSPTTELALVADSEGGAIWPDQDGVLTAKGRNSLVDDTRSITVQATFGDQDPAHLSYSDPKPSFDRAMITNQAVYTRVGGTSQTVTDEASRAAYGLKRDTRTDLVCQTDIQAATLAEWKVARYREPRRRIEQITVYPRKDPTNLWPVVLGARHRDLWRIVHHPPGGYTDDVYSHVSGISHIVQPGGQWTSVFDLWSASPYLEFSTSKWDVGTWGSSKWFM